MRLQIADCRLLIQMHHRYPGVVHVPAPQRAISNQQSISNLQSSVNNQSAINNQQSTINNLMITPTHYMLLSAALFMIGVIGVMVRRNIIIIFMSIELILNAVNINLVAFSAQLQNQIGQVFAIFVIAVAAAEAAVGLGIILAFYRNKETVNIDEMNLMRW
jgi:NADH-quinone oxidoreductase subunit K